MDKFTVDNKCIVFNKNIFVELINSLVEESIVHGADAGGSYNSNKEGVEKALNEIMEFFDLTDEYMLAYVELTRYIGNTPYSWDNIPRLILK